jgi:hypothetical protein
MNLEPDGMAVSEIGLRANWGVGGGFLSVSYIEMHTTRSIEGAMP